MTRGQIASLSGAELDALRELVRTEGPIATIKRLRDRLQTGLYEAQNVMFVLREQARAADGTGAESADDGAEG